MAKAIDVVIIGAGPAGSVCGYLLKKAGVNCVIVDYATFPREKICGGGLTPKAYELLQDVMPELHYDYQSVTHFKLMLDGEVLCEVDLAKALRRVRLESSAMLYSLGKGLYVGLGEIPFSSPEMRKMN